MVFPPDNALTILGETDFHGQHRRLGIQQRDRRAHMWVIGKTGTGKSTLLRNLIYSDLVAGRGVMLIDPHGDLVESILDLVPESRTNDTLYFDPADTTYPIAFNPLNAAPGVPAALIASGLIATLKKTWPEFWGPRMEYILRNSLLTLLAAGDATLLDLHRLLVDAPFRREIVGKVTDRQLLQFWHQEFAAFAKPFRAETVSPILNKTGAFLMSPILRSILGQPTSAFSFRNVIDDGMVFLANLSRGRIGEDVASLLGSLLVGQLQLSALTRTDTPEESRRPFFLYIDEAHLVTTRAMVELFPEARKFGLGVILAHQYLDQLDEDLRYAVLGNVGTMIVFRIGARDATVLAKEFAPEFEELDLVSLPAYQACIKLLVDSTTTRPFTVRTLPAPDSKESESTRQAVIDRTRQRYASRDEDMKR